MQMGAAAKTSSQNSLGKKKKRFQGVKKGQNKNRPPSLFANVSRPPFPPPTIGMVRGMRRPPPFPPGRMHPGMRPIPPPGPAMRGPMPPPPLMRGPPGRIPPPPPMGMRPPPGVRPPPMMRPMPPPMIPPMGAPRPFGPSGGPVPLMGVPPRGRLGNRAGMKGKKFNKKKNSKNSSNEEVDLKKPWVTEEIKNEYSKKQDLLKTARESKKKEDWDSYKEQREKCYKMFNTAKLEYIGKHPEEVHLYCGTEDDSNIEDTEHYCDTCDREFNSADDLIEHEMQHQTCGIDGCTFNAHFKVITKHIQMQHSSGLFEKISSKNTPEDIEKWREERKKRYPTKKNIEERQKQKEEMLERGEKLISEERKFQHRRENKDRTLKRQSGNNAFQLKPKTDTHNLRKIKKTKINPNIKAFPKFDIEDEKSTWNENLPPFKGTKFLYDEDRIDTVIDDKLDIDDTEWDMSLPVQTVNVSAVVVNNSLGSLMSAYGSDAESEDDVNNSINTQMELCNKEKNNCDNIDISTSHISISNESLDISKNMTTNIDTIDSVDINNDDSGPEEKKIDKIDNSPMNISSDNINQNEKFNRKRKRKFATKNSEKKPFRHPGKTNYNPLNKKSYHKRPTLLEKLLSNEIRHERNVIFQCVNYIVQNNFFGIGMDNKNTSKHIKE